MRVSLHEHAKEPNAWVKQNNSYCEQQRGQELNFMVSVEILNFIPWFTLSFCLALFVYIMPGFVFLQNQTVLSVQHCPDIFS